MEEDTVVGLPRPGGTVEDDPLLCVLRDGARQMLMHAIEAEVAAFLAAHADQIDERGRHRWSAMATPPSAFIQTGIGGIEVQSPRVRDRGAGDAARSTSLRRCRQPTCAAPRTSKSSCPGSTQRRFPRPIRARARGSPALAIGDGALGFWKAAKKVWPNVNQQRCWVHKTANVLNYVPKSLHKQAKADLHAIYEAESRAAAEAAFDRFLAKYQAKYDRAAHCLAKGREASLAFDVPAEHSKHIRTVNPIESAFAVRLRTAKTKGCLSRETAPSCSNSPSQPSATAPTERIRAPRRDRPRRPLPRWGGRHRGRGSCLTSSPEIDHR